MTLFPFLSLKSQLHLPLLNKTLSPSACFAVKYPSELHQSCFPRHSSPFQGTWAWQGCLYTSPVLRSSCTVPSHGLGAEWCQGIWLQTPALHLPRYDQLPVPKLYMEGYFIRALKGRKCHFVLTKTFRKKTGCKLFRGKVTFYSAGECDGEKKVHFLPSLSVEKNCRRVRAVCLPKWLPVASQFSPVLWLFTKQHSGCKEKWVFGLPFLCKGGHMSCRKIFLSLL